MGAGVIGVTSAWRIDNERLDLTFVRKKQQLSLTPLGRAAEIDVWYGSDMIGVTMQFVAGDHISHLLTQR